ncbi:hypothetical protein CCP3SC1AL1_40001 [Gammaproteobacteria bacterium]
MFYSKSLVRSSYSHKNRSYYDGFRLKKISATFSFLTFLTALFLSFFFFTFYFRSSKEQGENVIVKVMPTDMPSAMAEIVRARSPIEERTLLEKRQTEIASVEKRIPLENLSEKAVIPSSPTANSPMIQKGDTYIYKSYDQKSGAEVIMERTVLSVGNEIILYAKNNKKEKSKILYCNGEWNLIRTRNADRIGGYNYSPPLKYYDFPLYPGKTWGQTSTETDVRTGKTRIYTISGLVREWEELFVGTEKFMALRVDLETTLTGPNQSTENGTDISWYVPELRKSVRSEISSNKEGRVERRIMQLISYRLR